MLLGLRTVIYHAAELEEVKAWYADAFGIEPYFDEPFYVGFNVGGYELGLNPNPSTVTYGDNAVAYWGVEDIDAAYARLLSKGAVARDAIQEVGGGIRVGTVADPFGNVIGLIYNPHFKVASD